MSETTETGLKLPRIFSSGMVLQRQRPVAIWGWAKPNAVVELQLGDWEAKTRADLQGQWRAELAAMPAGGPYRLRVNSRSRSIIVEDVLIGDVWLCSGQSNMEFTLGANGEIGQKAIAAANDALIRHFTVAQNSVFKDAEDVQGKWLSATPENAPGFSSVGYFMAQTLRRELGVPIGIINSSWGGTTAEAWTPKAALQADPLLQPLAEFNEAVTEAAKPYADPGNEGFAKGWADPAHDDADWKTMDLPQAWERAGIDMDGSMWFRRHVKLPAVGRNQELTLSLGPLDDFDTTYFNGVQIGQTGQETPGWWSFPRVYKVPAKLLRPGDNVIATRVFDQWGAGGFTGRPEQLHLTGKGVDIKLTGAWKYKIELQLPSAVMGTAVPATSLWHGMITPLVGLGITGAAWYQGESNADRAYQYRTLLPAMVQAWRKQWNQGDFPFLIVQLANWITNDATRKQGEHWAELREAQEYAARKLSNAAIATAIDVGDPIDIHPHNKQPVGHRLALAALAIAHKQPVEYFGPAYESAKFTGKRAIVSFTHADGLHSTADTIQGFALAGGDRVFHPAQASIDGTQIIVQSAKVAKPLAVRYAWSDNPNCTLYNSAKLPITPFRSDDWPYVTEKKLKP